MQKQLLRQEKILKKNRIKKSRMLTIVLKLFKYFDTIFFIMEELIMKATGIVRRIDDLGRVVIPKEIRRTMRIREGDPLEIYTDADGEVIFKKYSPVGELSSIAKQYAEVLFRGTNLPVIITDRDRVISCAGLPKKEAVDRRVTSALEEIIESRTNYIMTAEGEK
jgi:AbrB family transcriptional regulator (stage V sporulation protein T)